MSFARSTSSSKGEPRSKESGLDVSPGELEPAMTVGGAHHRTPPTVADPRNAPTDAFVDPDGFRAYLDAAEAELRSDRVH